MKGIFVFIVLLFAVSCVTQRRCYEKFPPKVSTDSVYYEVVRDSLIYRDTTIVVEIPGETLIDSIYLNPDHGIESVHSDTLTLETEYARAEAYYKTPSIHLTLEQKDIYFQVKLDSIIRLEMHWKEMYTKIERDTETEVKYIPKIYHAALWGWGILIVISIMQLIVRKYIPHR